MKANCTMATCTVSCYLGRHPLSTTTATITTASTPFLWYPQSKRLCSVGKELEEKKEHLEWWLPDTLFHVPAVLCRTVSVLQDAPTSDEGAAESPLTCIRTLPYCLLVMLVCPPKIRLFTIEQASAMAPEAHIHYVWLRLPCRHAAEISRRAKSGCFWHSGT